MILFFSEDEVEVLFQKAIKQIKQEQFEEAADNLLNAAEGFAQFELFRRVGDCYVLRGEVLDELKLFKEATGAFERSIPFFYRADFILGVGKAYLLLARLGRRQYKIDKAKQQDPFATLQAVSDYERAHGIVLKAGYRLEAEEIRKELEPIYYSDIPAATMIFENAQIVYKADNISLAELMDTYKKLTQDYPTFLPAATELGMLYAQLGQRETAKSIFEQILVRDCRRAHVYVNLGNIYSELELFDEAATNYQKAIKLNPTLVFALTGLELTYRKQGVHYLRIDLLRQLTKLKPNDAIYYVLMGDAYLKQHLLSEATTAFQEALRRNDNEASVHQLLGIILIGQGKVTSGHQHLMRAKILDSNDVETHLYLASSWILQERFDEAQSHLELFARRQPFWVRLFYGFRQAVSINEKGAHYLVNWGMDRLAANYPYFALPCFLAAAKLYDYLAKQGVKPEESLLSKLGRHRKRVPHGTDKYPFPELGIAYLNQGVTYDAMNIWELSLTAFKQAREVFSNLGPTFQADLVVALHGIAQAYRYLRKFPESLAYLQQAERLIAKTSDDLTHGRMIFNQAGMLKSIDRLNECLDAYQRASTLFEQIQKGQIDLAKCLSGLADLTDTVANYLEEAEKKQLDLTKTQPGSYNLMDIAQRLFEVEIGGSRLASSPKVITVNALYELALKFEQRSFDLISHLEKVGYVSIDEHEFGQKSYITQDLQPIEVQVALSSRVLAFRYGRLGQFDPGHKRLDAAEKTFEHYKAVGGIDQLWLTRGDRKSVV